MKKSSSLLAFTALAALSLSSPAPAENKVHGPGVQEITPAEALKRLSDGNARFVAGKPVHPRQDPGRRTELAEGQHPFAIVLACADSRSSPEVVFDQGLGDLFVVRVAGQVLNDEILGSIEYAVEHLGAKTIVVLGHERCGAVKAARETLAAKAEAPGHIQSLVKAIRPAVEATTGGDMETTTRAHVGNTVKALSNSDPFLKKKTGEGKVAVVGATYDLDTGVVEFFKDRPEK